MAVSTTLFDTVGKVAPKPHTKAGWQLNAAGHERRLTALGHSMRSCYKTGRGVKLVERPLHSLRG